MEDGVKIECLTRREGGTIVEIGSTRYEFVPDEYGRHVCDVTDKKHIEIFSLIPEGYSLLDEPPTPPAAAPAPPQPPTPTPVTHDAALPDFPKRNRS